MQTNSSISHFAAVLPVEKMDDSLEFYLKVGFESTFKHGNPTDYAVLKNGNSQIHLTLKSDDYSPSKSHAHLFFFVFDIEGFFDKIKKIGDIEIVEPITTREYGMRDFMIVDPDGYRLVFGQGSSD